MACLALTPVPSRLFVPFQSHRTAPSCCQRIVHFSFPPRKLSLECSDWRRVRGEYDAGDVVSPNLRKSAAPRLLAATNLIEDVSSAYTGVVVENECRPASKPQRDYIVREANLDEELWAAAWIRAESYCEQQPYVRYIESYKKNFAEQEFDALKRRLIGRYGQSVKCVCFVAISSQSTQNCTNSDTRSATALERVVGTLDLSIRQLAHGEAFPGESIRATLSKGAPDVPRSQRYGYIANVCVTKAARRIGIASNLLGKAVKTAKEWDLKELYVHVDSHNKAGCQLYDKYDFQVMPAGAVQASEAWLYGVSMPGIECTKMGSTGSKERWSCSCGGHV